MTKEFAWFLGFLLTDGCINRPAYRNKGDETHIAFCIHIKDEEALHKIKNILNTCASVKTYPDYLSPQAKLCVYDRKDIIAEYSTIKTEVPSTIVGYERHFIRGLIDGDGCLYKRKNRNEFVLYFIDEYKNIVDWVNHTVATILGISIKPISYRKDHIYELRYSSKEARLVAWWLYHGDINNCCLARKLDYYKEHILNYNEFDNQDDELVYAIQGSITSNSIIPNSMASKTLYWCHILQKLLSIKCNPICTNKGKTKYYYLHIPKAS